MWLTFCHFLGRDRKVRRLYYGELGPITRILRIFFLLSSLPSPCKRRFRAPKSQVFENSWLLACVASVSNRVIARKLELSRRTSRGNACYAGYLIVVSCLWTNGYIIRHTGALSRFCVFFKMGQNNLSTLERFSYDLEMITHEQNRNNKRTEIERFDWSILHFDVILQHDWPIEQCLLQWY